jgi:hypothetical protein
MEERRVRAVVVRLDLSVGERAMITEEAKYSGVFPLSLRLLLLVIVVR